MLLNFLYHTKNFHKIVLATLMFSLLSSMSIVTQHAFMYEQNGLAENNPPMASPLMDKQSMHAMPAEDCQCQPGVCQSIAAQVDLLADGLFTTLVNLDWLSPISYFQEEYQSSELDGLLLANATINTTHPPINIRFQSFLI